MRHASAGVNVLFLKIGQDADIIIHMPTCIRIDVWYTIYIYIYQ